MFVLYNVMRRRFGDVTSGILLYPRCVFLVQTNKVDFFWENR